MSDVAAPASAAAPASPAPTGDAAVVEVLNTLPKDQQVVEGEIEDDGSDLPPDPEAEKKEKKAVAAAKKAYKLKVGGKDLEVDEAELLKRAQMGYSADEKWQEAAKIRKQMENLVQLIQKDPGKALEQMGYDVDKLAEERIQRRIAEMQKSPEQLEKEKIQQELADMKAEREREKQELQSQEIKRVQDQYAIDIENDITSAFKSNDGMSPPQKPFIVKRLADYMIAAVKKGIETNNPQLKNIAAKDVLPLVWKDIQDEQREFYAASPDEVFEQLIGKDRLNKYRRGKIKKTPKVDSAKDVKATGGKELQQARDDKKSNEKKQSTRDFFKSLGTF